MNTIPTGQSEINGVARDCYVVVNGYRLQGRITIDYKWEYGKGCSGSILTTDAEVAKYLTNKPGVVHIIFDSGASVTTLADCWFDRVGPGVLQLTPRDILQDGRSWSGLPHLGSQPFCWVSIHVESAHGLRTARAVLVCARWLRAGRLRPVQHAPGWAEACGEGRKTSVAQAEG